MNLPKTPGVYIQEISKFPPSVAQVETAIPAFIGYTELIPAGFADPEVAANPVIPVRITSLLEYEQHFGRSKPQSGITVTITDKTQGGVLTERAISAAVAGRSVYNMYYAMQAFFANGGGPCYIASVGVMKEAAPPNPIVLPDVAQLQKGLAAIEKEDEVTLLVFPEAQSLAPANYAAVISAAVAQCAKLQDRFVVMDMPPATVAGDDILDAAEDFRALSLTPLDQLKYTAAYAPNVMTIFDYLYDEADVIIAQTVDGAAGGVFNTLAMSAVKPVSTPTVAPQNAAVYNAIKAAIGDIELELPPSPLVVGQYATVDNSRGVWKAPANVALASVSRPASKVSHEEQMTLNVHESGKSINIIRTFPGKGTLIWGARTLAGNDNEWRYVSVRRFFNMAEESIKKASEQFVFEPNDANTWVKVKAMIENFLLLQWRAGALAGAVPEQAFFVKVGLNETMTALDILEGRMNVEIGMAVVRPAEFIILRFSHKMQES